MEKYNKVYLALWLLFIAITFALMVTFVLNSLAVMIDLDEVLEGEGLALSFLLLFFISEVVGVTLASLTIDRIPWAHDRALGLCLRGDRRRSHSF
jgi:inner membrane protein involved in colicin E2 resistance